MLDRVSLVCDRWELFPFGLEYIGLQSGLANALNPLRLVLWEFPVGLIGGVVSTDSDFGVELFREFSKSWLFGSSLVPWRGENECCGLEKSARRGSRGCQECGNGLFGLAMAKDIVD